LRATREEHILKNITPSSLVIGLLVTPLLVGACSEASPPAREAPEQTEIPLTVPLPNPNRFVLLTRGDAKFGRRFRAVGGSIGVAVAPAPGVNTCTVRGSARRTHPGPCRA
jgi:hypothetical protein